MTQFLSRRLLTLLTLAMLAVPFALTAPGCEAEVDEDGIEIEDD